MQQNNGREKYDIKIGGGWKTHETRRLHGLWKRKLLGMVHERFVSRSLQLGRARVELEVLTVDEDHQEHEKSRRRPGCNRMRCCAEQHQQPELDHTARVLVCVDIIFL
jgi:hypothetical protein